MDDQTLKGSRILILAADEEGTALRRVLQPVGYLNVTVSGDIGSAVTIYDRVQPDLILLDVSDDDGARALELIHARIPADDPVPIIAIAPVVGVTVRLRSLAMGAKDFLPKPIDDAEALTRVGNLLENRLLQLQVMGGPRLEVLADNLARARTRSLEDIQVELLERFAKTAEFRDFPEHGHRERVASVARLLALELGFPEERADLIGRASLLHDIGKIGVPESIWQKPARLTPEEFAQVKSHTKIGAEILSQGRSPLLWLAEEIAHTHHEHWNGNGYLGLQGDAIPIPGRIVAIADAYDALTTDRPYRKARPVTEALDEITREAGHHFDPQLVEAFMRVVDESEFQDLYGTSGPD